MRHRTLFAMIISGLALISHRAIADTVTLIPSKDNTLYESSTGALSNGAGQHLFAGRTATGNIRRGLLAFDIDGSIPSGATIDDVTLTLYMSRTRAVGKPVTLHRLLRDWGEGASAAGSGEGGGAAAAAGDATWLHTFSPSSFWLSIGGDFVATASATQSVAGVAYYDWISTVALIADVQLWLDEPGKNFGWLVKSDESVAGSSKRFDTREVLLESFRPGLEVKFTRTPVQVEAITWGRVKARSR